MYVLYEGNYVVVYLYGVVVIVEVVVICVEEYFVGCIWYYDVVGVLGVVVYF